MGFLGIDTSNYTTSAAVLPDNGEMIQMKMPLPVGDGALGLRQSDAVFAHVKQLGVLLERLMQQYGGEIRAVGASVSPRDEEGSYMPCFLAGKMCAQAVAAALKVPLYEFSHQAGHVAAALYDTGLDELFSREFIAFHISGGTTQALLVKPDEDGKKPFKVTTVAKSLDLHAGQVIDRVGAMLGLGFPAGAELETLACGSSKDYAVKIAFKGLDCCLSGVENQCCTLLEKGENPYDVARFCLKSIEWAVLEMTRRVAEIYPGRKLVYSGGVMSNAMIRDSVTSRFDAAFASPAFSADNAAGIAVLCKKSYLGKRMAI